MFRQIVKREDASATAPMPPPTPGIPVERHPSNDDWETTFVAILLMSLIVFVTLGILVRRSFRLVPTGVMALRTLVGNRTSSSQYHRLDVEEDEDFSDGDEEQYIDNGALDTRDSHARDAPGQRCLEVLSDNDVDYHDGDEAQSGDDDARIINIGSSSRSQENTQRD
ncbi:hypothetical protein GGI25_000872 [Coemansia spiralis]|uniref:Uncharacterized protein n=2 Tax=Coemansia TaxID=4863 RepID=A0A9W8GBY1_9FUNG|nr:hypothetical protein BX070DRAFT_251735 [Coemansia spiralis]KAJ1994091.1 hypothetical protein EDC05_001761 [Coemansia umbellata]KAJ2623609.1 hypothetical protein GGI26_002247 [Coemansia sp. RSA 1358]KAJ2680279.1 hypothetical protein GGI25_000872 [Coemansia spiralis]